MPSDCTSSPLNAISPLDGRYHSKVDDLRPLFSEFGLIKARVNIEIEWLIHLSRQPDLPEIAEFSDRTADALRAIVDQFEIEDALKIKQIESTTNHDVKAVEYYVKEQVKVLGIPDNNLEFVHFACTSEDINNLSYALLLKESQSEILKPRLATLAAALRRMAQEHQDQAMLSRTHGQPASPTTLGKEFANFVSRLNGAQEVLSGVAIRGKMNGAVGNFNAHYAAYPEAPWESISQSFVEGLGLASQAYSTQIEPHDTIAEFCHALSRINTIVLDLDRDLWGYVSLGYFRQKAVAGEVGSSTMPHKVNPIDFENSEGNLGIANAILGHLADKLPISRWQRDLSDSTALRNLGVGIGHSLIAWDSTLKGLGKLAADKDRIETDLNDNWAVLAEAIQTVMRRYGVPEPYEQLKALTRGQDNITQSRLHAFIAELEIPEPAKHSLLALTPANYTGHAVQAARDV
ncbi:MAG: adenylosuccinate lyase [Gammaproteobacteria bacterium]|nr:adenylosuccinate lyase [Gammaproteobacteria bacterium]